jgi:hypothetical protein
MGNIRDSNEQLLRLTSEIANVKQRIVSHNNTRFVVRQQSALNMRVIGAATSEEIADTDFSRAILEETATNNFDAVVSILNNIIAIDTAILKRLSRREADLLAFYANLCEEHAMFCEQHIHTPDQIKRLEHIERNVLQQTDSDYDDADDNSVASD